MTGRPARRFAALPKSSSEKMTPLAMERVTSAVASLPLVNLIVLYYVALTPWPVEGRASPPAAGPDAGF